MTSDLANVERKRARTRSVHLALAALAALVAFGGHADAKGGRSQTKVESVQSREAGEPIMAIVSLGDQRITVYDVHGWILRAPVSSGQKGRETPAGIFSVIQKDAEHYSNLYDDAYMPNMQRITWSGIALHGGALPGYAASHGCVRLPYDFAADLFDRTDLGLRVIVAPTDVAPEDITHPLLFQSKPGDAGAASARIAEAGVATKKADEAKRAAGNALRDQMRAMAAARIPENMIIKAQARLAAANAAFAAANASDEDKELAEEARGTATATISALETAANAAKADLQAKTDALTAARSAAEAAETTRAAAAEAAQQAQRGLAPVSILISRKTQKLYVRQSFEPVFDAPVTIADPDRPIGTHVFTAMERPSADVPLRWSAVTLESPQGDDAKAALDRITIPQDVLDRIASVSPRSSLIVTDEPPSQETGKGTDFVILLSDQPQGGIKFRRHGPSPEVSYYGGSTYARPPRGFMSYWGPQSRGGW